MVSRQKNSHRQASATRTWLPVAARVGITCTLCGILLAFVFNLRGNVQESADEESGVNADARLLAVNVLAAVRANVHTEQRSYIGLIKARRIVDLSFPRAARLERLLVDHGDTVSEGDALAELNTQHLVLKKEALDRALEEAQVELAKTLADPRLQEPNALRRSIAELKQEFAALKKQFDRAESDPPNTLRATTASRLEAAQRNLNTLDALTRQQVEAQEKAVADLQAQLTEVNIELKESTLVAPFDGVIAVRHVSESSLVAPSRPVLRIVDQNNLEAWVAVPLSVAAEFARGQAYEINADGQTFEAEVFAVLPEVDPSTRSRTAVLTLNESASRQLAPGEVFQLNLQREVQGEGYWFPLSALTRQTRGLWSVYVVQEDASGVDRVSRRLVEVMHLDGERAWVRGMLEDGERIIANGTQRIVEGQRVKANDESGAAPLRSPSVEEAAL